MFSTLILITVNTANFLVFNTNICISSELINISTVVILNFNKTRKLAVILSNFKINDFNIICFFLKSKKIGCYL